MIAARLAAIRKKCEEGYFGDASDTVEELLAEIDRLEGAEAELRKALADAGAQLERGANELAKVLRERGVV